MLKSIHLNRAEGPIRECVKKECVSFEEAERVIRQWARSAPDRGGYDKVDAKFVLDGVEDGEDTVITIRFDMTRDHTVKPNPLRNDLIVFCRFYSGGGRPDHMKPEHYEDFLKRITEKDRSVLRKAIEVVAQAK